ncbi:MAG: hypothetical protein ACI4EI_09810 [Muricoprocola sp.]
MAKPEICDEKAITAGDFAWLFRRYWNAREQITKIQRFKFCIPYFWVKDNY